MASRGHHGDQLRDRAQRPSSDSESPSSPVPIASPERTATYRVAESGSRWREAWYDRDPPCPPTLATVLRHSHVPPTETPKSDSSVGTTSCGSSPASRSGTPSTTFSPACSASGSFSSARSMTMLCDSLTALALHPSDGHEQPSQRIEPSMLCSTYGHRAVEATQPLAMVVHPPHWPPCIDSAAQGERRSSMVDHRAPSHKPQLNAHSNVPSVFASRMAQVRGSAPPLALNSQVSEVWQLLPSPMTPKFRPPMHDLMPESLLAPPSSFGSAGAAMLGTRTSSTALPLPVKVNNRPEVCNLPDLGQILAGAQRPLSSMPVFTSLPGRVPVSTVPVPTLTHTDANGSSNRQQNLYKTELCRSWEEKGHCDYGQKCQFAHGQDELRAVQRHPKWKTELCRTYWRYGSCPYARRCCFIHEPIEAHNSAIATSEGGKRAPLFARIRTATDSDASSVESGDGYGPSHRHQRASTDPLACFPSSRGAGASDYPPASHLSQHFPNALSAVHGQPYAGLYRA